MPYYEDPLKQRTFIGNPELNPELTQGKTLIGDTINSDVLAPVQELQLPPIQPEPDYQASLNAIPQYNPAPTATETQQDDLSTSLLKITEQLGGRDVAQAQAEEQFGVTKYQKELTDITGQIEALRKEAVAIPIRIEEESRSRGRTRAGIQPLVSGELRNITLQALGLSSIAQTLQRQVGLAQQQANRAVDLRFTPLENELKTLSLQIELNKDKLNREDRLRAEQRQFIIEERRRFLSERREDTQTAQAMANATIKFNPGNSVALLAAQQVLKLNPEDPQYLQKVFQLVGRYQSDPNQLAKDLVDLEFKRKQIKAMDTDTNLASQKFEEDKRRFNLEYALKQSQKISEIAADKLKSQDANVLKSNALVTAQQLLTDFQSGKGTSAVGGNIQNRLGLLGDWLGKGTGRADFIVKFNNLKSLLSLDNVKYLKGQGQVSDAERRLLEQASAKLDRSQSESEFSTALGDIVNALSGNVGSLADQVRNAGYNYEQMKADGHSDEEIKRTLNL